jgi:hypothetical protein
MGIVTMGPDFRVIEFIKQNYKVSNFIETGTYQGGTTEAASNIFERVFSIEFSEHWYDYTKERLAAVKNIQLFFGDTRAKLPEIMPQIDNAILWLDAHWCSNHSFGEEDQCPILEELDIINSFEKINQNIFILIDDARLFTSPPAVPHSLTDYPDLLTVIDHLKKDRVIYIFNDIIYAIPLIYKKDFDPFLQELATIEENKVVAHQPISLKRQVLIRIKQKLSKFFGLK